MKIKYLLTYLSVFILFCLNSTDLFSQPDTIAIITRKDTVVKRNIFKKTYNFFSNINNHNNFDIQFAAFPHYSSDTKFGVGLAATGIYNTNGNDPATPLSNISLFGDVTTTGFYMLGVRGSNIFTQEKWKIDYMLSFSSLPGKFWGIGYDNGNNHDNKTDFTKKQASIKADFLFKATNRVFAGPTASYEYSRGKNFTNQGMALINPDSKTTRYASLGAIISYDSRDFASNASNGIYTIFSQKGYTNFTGKPFFSTSLIFDFYRRVKEGTVLALDFFGELQYGEVPWTMKSQLGGINRMRGYYKGRYRDDSSFSLQLECRQKIYKKHGAVAWVGCGTIWGKENKFNWSHILPNYGVGYRWEFSERMNIRLDYGFGKNGQNSLLFSINEAF